ncbi:MFS transporter [Sphingomonas oryzagri]
MTGTSRYGEPIGPTPAWDDDERPTTPGSAAMPHHPMPRRIAYGLVAALCGITAGLGNALVSANLPQIQGHLGLTPVEGQWLPAAYLMTNVSANLLLFKFRQQYGLRRFAQIGMPIYALVTMMHLFVESFAMAVFVRAVSGFATSVLSTFATLYMTQAFGKRLSSKGMVIGVGLSQLATPIAWLLSPPLLDLGEWQTLYLFESGLALCCLSAVSLLHLPLGQRIRVYEWQDLVTFLLLAPALALLAAVLAQGRTQWWTSQPWIAWALIAALLLGIAGLAFERYREHPLIQLRWIGTADTIRLVIGAIAIRFLLSEQTFGAVGLLRQLGMGPDQLQPLYACMLLGLVVGIGLSALTFGPKTMIPQILISVVLIAVASFLDHDSTSLIRPHDMFVSQTLISVGAGMFLAPLLLTTITRALSQGPEFIISASVLFSISQSLGGLMGPAVLGTFQQIREHDYSASINADVDPTDPVVANRLRLQGGTYARVLTDPVLQQAEGVAALAQAATQQANVRAYDDVFLLTGVLAILDLAWSLFHVLRAARRRKRAALALIAH